MKKILMVLTVVLLLAGCGETHKLHNGKVYASFYHPAYDTHEEVCDWSSSNGFCYMSHTDTTHHEAEYFITLSECFENEHSGCRHEDFQLTHDAWINTPVGSKWGDGSGKVNEK